MSKGPFEMGTYKEKNQRFCRRDEELFQGIPV